MTEWNVTRDSAVGLSVPILGVEKERLNVEETDWGYIVEKGNSTGLSFPLIEHVFGDVPHDLRDEYFVLHERVLVMGPHTRLPENADMRSHEEEFAEVAGTVTGTVYKNAKEGGVSFPVRIMITKGPERMVLFPDQEGKQEGFYHGIATVDGGALYVAKLLRPDYVEGKSFRMPENTYRKRAT